MAGSEAWFPATIDRWLRAAKTRPKPWCEEDRILDLRCLLWAYGSVPFSRAVLAERWGVSKQRVCLVVNDLDTVLPEGIVSMWESRWKFAGATYPPQLAA